MSIKNIRDIRGSGDSGDDPDPPRPAVEDPNNLHSRNTLKFIDMWGEGEIFGLVEGDPTSGDGKKSIYLNDVPLMNESGDLNFGGVTAIQKLGTSWTLASGGQTIVDGFSSVETNVSTGLPVEVRIDTGAQTKSISSNDVDEVVFTITLPQMSSTDITNGDIHGTTIQLTFSYQIDGGSWQPFPVPAATPGIIIKTGKCTAPYRFEQRYEIPWAGGSVCQIRVTRNTPDSTSVYLNNTTIWTSYTEIINEKLIYPDTAYVAYTVDAEKFGSSAPTRVYDLKGLLISVPDNYDPDTIETLEEQPLLVGGSENFIDAYTGAWGGVWSTNKVYSNNPAYVYYDILTNERYGMGIDPAYIDKWAIYTAGYYCDGKVSSGLVDDDDNMKAERRFTFNGVIENRQEAYHILNMISSVFRSMPWWGTGLATISPDMPRDPERLVTAANVIGGNFEYQGTGLAARHTVAHVTWNDPDDFCKPRVEVVQDAGGIARYGVNTVEVVAYGCTSRGQAQRFGRWMLYTDINQTEIVTYRAGFDHADCVPGEIVKVLDPDYATVRYGGRVVSSTSTVLTMDAVVDIELGNEYTLYTTTSSGTLQNNPVDEGLGGDTSTIEITDTFAETPDSNSVWMLTSSGSSPLAARHFRVLSVIEKEPHTYEVNAVYHDPNKFAIVEELKEFDDPPFVKIPSGKLAAPTNLEAEEYTYSDGASNQQFGVLLSWEHSTDPRTYFYETQIRNNLYGEVWHAHGGTRGTGETGDNSIDIRPVVSGTYDFRTRAKGVIDTSEWLTLSDFEVYGDPDPLPDITGLQVVGGGTTFAGKDCEIEWDTVSGTVYRWKDYVVEVYTTGDALLRTDQVKVEHYTYWYDWNVADNASVPIRSIKFKVYARDTYDKLSQVAATATMSNPAPSMAGLTPDVVAFYRGINVEIDNIVPADNDYKKTVIYCDTSNPPTTEVGQLSLGNTVLPVTGLDPTLTYRVQCEPYDTFGVGTKSSVTGATDPLDDSIIDVDAELTNSIIMSDSIGTTSSGLQILYDRDVYNAAKLVDLTSAAYWVQYDYVFRDFMDRVTLYMTSASEDCRVYFALSQDDQATWQYYGHPISGVHDLSYGEYMSEYAVGAVAAQYINVTELKNMWRFPERTTASNFKVFFVQQAGVDIEIAELVPCREVIVEQLVADNLSSISADVGVLRTGLIQSNTVSDDAGVLIDLTNEQIRIGGAASPFLLADGVNNYLSLSGDTYMEMLEGGKFAAGDGNFLMSTAPSDNHFTMTIAEDGGIATDGTINNGFNYMVLDDGSIKSFVWHSGSGSHKEFRTLRKVAGGSTSNNTWANVGFFESAPEVLLSPATLQCYDASTSTQDQSFHLEVRDLQQLANGDWQFRPYAQLQKTANSGAIAYGSQQTTAVDGGDLQRGPVNTPANTNKVTVYFTIQSYRSTTIVNQYYYRTTRYRIYIDGAWTGFRYYNHGASLGAVALSWTIEGLTPGAKSVYVWCDSYNAGGTFYSGSAVWEYQWHIGTPTGSVSLSKYSTGAQDSGTTAYLTMPALPAVTAGWQDTGTARSYASITTGGSSTGGASNNKMQGYVQGLGDLGSTANIYINHGSTNNYTGHIYYRYELGNWNDANATTVIPWTYSVAGQNLRLYVSANALYDPFGTVSQYGAINYLRTDRYEARPAPGSSATYSSLTFDSVSYWLSGAVILADGTVNYLAIDKG